MIHGATFSGNLFFDPLATKLADVPRRADNQDSASPGPSVAAGKRGVQTAAEHKALRAASLSKVSRDLERMLRERRR